MKRILQYSFGFLFCIHVVLTSHAQVNANFPVNINPVLFPPYPFSLNYLNVATKPCVRTIIYNKSSNATVLNGLLKVIVKTNSYTAQTKSFDVAYPITLIGNAPISLTNVDMSSLFSFSNLSGLTYEQYLNDFPQASVSITFILYEAISKRQISQFSNYTYVFTKESPPLLNMPYNDSTFIDEGFPNILFQWTPRQVSPIGSVKYIFEMVETPVAFPQSPALAFSSNPLFFSDSTFATTYLYSAANPMFRPEFQYSWRIRAVANDYGGFTNSVFGNNGYSAPRDIYYAKPCVLPTNITITPDLYSLDVSWSKLSERQSITFYSQLVSTDAFTDNYNRTHHINVQSVEQVPSGNTDNSNIDGWTNLGTATASSGEHYHIPNLATNATYRIKWKAECQTPANHLQEPILFSTAKDVSTRDADSVLHELMTAQTVINAVCGKLPETPNLSRNLLSSLSVNDIIYAGDFKIIVKTGVTGSNGIFTGTGVIEMWLGKVFNANVSFNQVKINQDHKLIEGTIKLVSPL